MLPAEEFDSPAELAARFDLIRGEGAAVGAFHGVEAPRVTRGGGVPGVSASAVLHVPESAPFFADHFPRRPVYPATLLLDAQIGLAMAVANEATHWRGGARPAPARMTHMKMRSFIPPGSAVAIDAELAPGGDASASIRLTARIDGKTAASARLEVAALPPR
jgi:3-hydroxymyristoyl/3-hydroxydecanoyl-(acyl carrier protein) dehydratase